MFGNTYLSFPKTCKRRCVLVNFVRKGNCLVSIYGIILSIDH